MYDCHRWNAKVMHRLRVFCVDNCHNAPSRLYCYDKYMVLESINIL